MLLGLFSHLSESSAVAMCVCVSLCVCLCMWHFSLFQKYKLTVFVQSAFLWELAEPDLRPEQAGRSMKSAERRWLHQFEHQVLTLLTSSAPHHVIRHGQSTWRRGAALWRWAGGLSESPPYAPRDITTISFTAFVSLLWRTMPSSFINYTELWFSGSHNQAFLSFEVV